MTQHTPGPWLVWSGFPDCRVTVAIGSVRAPYIAKINAGRDEYRENARLIAAAPDLLAALEVIANSTWPSACPPDWCDMIRAAIAKVRREP